MEVRGNLNQSYYYSPRRQNKVRSRRRFAKFFSYLIILAVIIIPAITLLKINGRTVYANITNSPKVLTPAQLEAQREQAATKLATLSSSVNSVINNNPAIDFEVSSVDITGGDKQLTYGQTGPVTAASVSKILTATDFLQEVELGKQSLTQIFDDGDSASYALQQMIVASDDDAWEDLNNQLTYPQIQDYANRIGVNSFQWQNNTLSAYDTANLLAKLFEGKLLNIDHTNLLLGYLKQANYRQFIVPAVPSYDTVYHKIGEEDDNVNDAAIITNQNQSQAITLAIFTNGNGEYEWPERAVMMQQITTAFLTYYGLIS